MSTAMSPEQEQRIRARAESDAEFRARLDADPKAAIAEELGRELSDEELDRVAGGLRFGSKYHPPPAAPDPEPTEPWV
jgi:hypothetical protein